MPPRLIFFLSAFILFGTLCGQTDSIGEWRTLPAYRYSTYVTESAQSIIHTTGRAIFFLDKDDLSITRLAREDGLDQARIRLIRYHEPTETLIIVYENSVIDLYRNGVFSTLRQIDNFNFSGNKQINELFFGEGNVVYLAAGFGLSALDLEEETFLFTTFTGVAVTATAIYEGFIYVATNEGIYRTQRQGTNLNDFGNWTLLGAAHGFPDAYGSSAIQVYRDRLYFGIDQDIYRLQRDSADLFYEYTGPEDWELRYLSANGPEWLIGGYRCQGARCRGPQVFFFSPEGLQADLDECVSASNYALEDARGRIWLAETRDLRGIRYIPTATNQDCQILEYGGPLNDDVYRLHHDGTSLWVAPGILDENFSPRFSAAGVFRFRDGTWENYRRSNTAIFRGRDGAEQGDDDLGTIVDVHYDPVNDLHWFSSFFEGAAAVDAETLEGEIFDEQNGLELAEGAGDGRVRVAGVVTDPEGFNYLAISRAASGSIVSVRSPDGQWANLGQSCNQNVALDIAIDQSGYIWVIHATSVGGGITVIDPMGTPLDPADDRCRTITTGNSALPTNGVRSIAVDLRGNVWVGTAQGIVLFECGNAVFDTEVCQGRLPIVEANGFGGFLLETEEIRSITVDGGNRKWIGTGGGAYLLSPTGDEQLLFFDEGNSPLLNNLVRDIAVDPTNGTVYFGTDLGIISYRATATAATRFFREEPVIFPNPVEPGYSGPIAVNGLARDATVKITDVSGKLVAQGTATGGQFVWEGTDYTGRRVTTGVYLVFASSDGSDPANLNNPQAAVGKIVFIR